MSVEELSEIHLRYVILSDRFKAAWTFHQFLQGVNKVFSDAGIGDEALSFHEIYADLKTASKNLHSSSSEKVTELLERTEENLRQGVLELSSEDAKIEPALLRRFFGRVKRYDDRILVQLLKFYVYNRSEGGWSDASLDKADFLMTHLGDALLEPDRDPIERDPRRFREALESIWKAADEEEPSEEQADDTLVELRTLREAMQQIDSIEQFNHLGLVRRHRELKHDLRGLLFFPAIAVEVATNNLLLRSRINAFYRKEEERIAAEFQEVFDLEQGTDADSELTSELRSFHGEVEELERRRAGDNFKLDQLAHVREHARTLLPKLREVGDSESEPEDTAEVEAHAFAKGPRMSATAGLPEERPDDALRVRTNYASTLGDPLRQLLRLLEDTDWKAAPAAVTQTPEARPLRLESREIVAYRRLHCPEHFETELEQFLLEGAALRIRITAEAEEIIGTIDLLGPDREGEVFERARSSCQLASTFERRLSHFVAQKLLEGDAAEARTLMLHRMRLLRDYSGLWLLAYG